MPHGELLPPSWDAADANRQRGDLADAMFQEMKRQIAEKLRDPS